MGAWAGHIPARILVALALIASPAAAAPLMRAASATPPTPPPGQDLATARDAVALGATAASRAADRVAAAQASLDQLVARAETLVESYDGAVVEVRKATGAYQVARGRFDAATRAQAARQSAVGELATEAYQTDGGFGSMAAMIGGPGGPQAFFDRAGVLRVIAARDSDVLVDAVAARRIAHIFRGQARAALRASQAAVGRAGMLKRAAQAAVDRQRRVLRSMQATRNRLLRQLAAARATEGALELAEAPPSPSPVAGADASGAGGSARPGRMRVVVSVRVPGRRPARGMSRRTGRCGNSANLTYGPPRGRTRSTAPV